MRPLLALVVVLAACAAEPSAEPSASEPAEPRAVPGMLERLPPVEGLPHHDPRLAAVLAELDAHPEWLGGALDDAEIMAAVPGVDHVCLALSRTAGPDIIVAVEAATDPWSVASVAIDRGAEGREITYDATGIADDACYFVILGYADPWPASADEVRVLEAVAGDEAAAVGQALFARPQEFGIDMRGRPEIAVHDVSRPMPEGWRCWRAVVFVGGPRAEVVIGTRQSAGGWQVTSRVTQQALHDPAPRPPDGC